MKQVNKFKYIDSFKSKARKCDTVIRRCIGIAKVAFQNVVKVLSNRNIVRNKEENVLNCYVTSVFLTDEDATSGDINVFLQETIEK